MKFATVTNPCDDDIGSLKKLWKDVFKDTDSYIELFFNEKFKKENTFIIKENGALASMFFCVENTLKQKENELKGVYLCGLATNEAYRKKGYASRIIEHILSNVKADVFYLIPASRSLFSYYERFGFKPFSSFTKTKIELTDNKIGNFSTTFSYEKLNNFYEGSQNSFFVKRDFNDFKTIYDCYKNFMIFNDGYIVYSIENKTLNITEYTLSLKKVNDIGSYLIKKNGLKEGFILERYGSTPFSAFKSDTEIDIKNCYINLLLN